MKIVNHIYLNMTANILQAVIWCLITENTQKKAERLIVKKECRNKGIGQEVLKEMINLCKSKDYKFITLGVDTDNENAIHIYKKNGFKIYETDIDKYGKYYKMILTI